jgi:hypothetical protein
MNRAQLGDSFAIGAMVVAIAGGLFIGLASCGGYVWYGQLVFALTAFPAVIAFVLPGKLLSSWARRLAFPMVLLLTFVLVEAMAAPFYPAAPDSVDQFLWGFKRRLLGDSC